MNSTDSGEEPLYRNYEYKRAERDQKKVDKKRGWFRLGGKFESVLYK